MPVPPRRFDPAHPPVGQSPHLPQSLPNSCHTLLACALQHQLLLTGKSLSCHARIKKALARSQDVLVPVKLPFPGQPTLLHLLELHQAGLPVAANRISLLLWFDCLPHRISSSESVTSATINEGRCSGLENVSLQRSGPGNELLEAARDWHTCQQPCALYAAQSAVECR